MLLRLWKITSFYAKQPQETIHGFGVPVPSPDKCRVLHQEGQPTETKIRIRELRTWMMDCGGRQREQTKGKEAKTAYKKKVMVGNDIHFSSLEDVL